MFSRIRNEEASLTLEAAVVFPLLLLYVSLLYALSLGIRCEMLWHEAARSAIRECALLSAFYQDEKILQTTSERTTDDLHRLPFDYAAEKLSSAFIRKRQRYYFEENGGDQGLMPFFIRDAYGFIENKDGRLYYSYSFRRALDPELSLREFRLPLPFWGGVRYLNTRTEEDFSESDTAEEDTIWSESNLVRGRYFREKEGADLPFNFPVIAAFQNGEAKSIKSMDLTAPSYRDEERIREVIGQHAEALAAFEGADYGGKHPVSIKGEMIQKRTLHLVLPENRPASADRILREEKEKLAAEGISLEWVFRGESRKYED